MSFLKFNRVKIKLFTLSLKPTSPVVFLISYNDTEILLVAQVKNSGLS